jgi:hypothetical protein
MIWVVEIQTASPDDVDKQVLADQLAECINRLGLERSSGACDEDGWALSVSIHADDLRAAWSLATKMMFEAAIASGLPLWTVTALSVIEAEYAASMNRWFEPC